MEMAFEFSCFFQIFLPFLAFVIIFLKLKHARTTTNLPPGPWKLPIIGNLHQLVSSLPHQRISDLAKQYGPLMHLQVGEVSTVVVSSAEVVREIMKTHDLIFATRPSVLATDILFYNSTSVGFSPYGHYWRQLRKILIVELLSSRRVQFFNSIREEEISNLVNLFASKAGSPVNVTNYLSLLTNDITLRAAFGTKCVDQGFRSVVLEILATLTGLSLADAFPSIQMLQWITGVRSKLEKLSRKMDNILESIISEHKQYKATLEGGESEESKDLLDVLLKIQQDGSDAELQLTADNVKAVVLDIFIAGIESSAITMDWAMSELMRNPRLMKKAQAEVRQVFDRKGKFDETTFSETKFLKAILKETLRLHPVAPLISRVCRERCEINGFEIPAQAKVVINAMAIGRDPKYWNESERFIPERFMDSPIDYKGNNFEYIPFGGGRRICPGMSFATANMEVLLAKLLYQFDWQLPDGMKPEDLDMTEKFGLAVARKDELKLIPILYQPSFVA